MAKDEIDRAARAGADDVAGASRQQDAAALLKKMKVLDADQKASADTDHPQVAEASEAQVVAGAEGTGTGTEDTGAESGDVSVPGVAESYAASESSGGLSTATLLTIGGVALVAGGIAIAASDDDNGGGGGTAVTSVTPSSATVNEGQSVTFTIVGKPGSTFDWSLSGTAANGDDIEGPLAGTVTIGNDGTAIVSVTTKTDLVNDPNETLTLTVGGQSATVTVANVFPPAPNANLTTATDTLDFTNTSGANVVKGVVDPANPLTQTYTNGDSVTGNGETVLQLTIGSTGPAALANLDSLGAVNIVNGVFGGGTVLFNAVNWNDIGSLNLTSGSDGLRVVAVELERDTDMSVAANISGTVTGEFTDNSVGEIYAGRDSTISWIDNDVDATVAASESAFFGLSYTGAAALDLTVGNVSATVGQNADFGMSITASGAGIGDITVGDVSVVGANADTGNISIWMSGPNMGDITVGDVTMTGFDEANISIWRWTGAANAGGNVTVGDITASIGDTGANDLNIQVGNWIRDSSTASVTNGNVSVGNVSATIGDNQTGFDLWISNSASNTGSGDASIGNVTVGDISFVGGDSSTNNELYVYQGAWADSGDAFGGNITVGDFSVTVGKSSSADFDLENYASATAGTGSATLGNLTVGSISLTAGQNSTITGFVLNSANSDGGSATAGDVTVGAVDITLGQNAVGTLSITNSAEVSVGSGAATVGNLTVGNVTMSLDVDSTAYLYISAYAEADKGDATVGNVSIGDMIIDMGVNSYANVSITVSATYNDTPGLMATIGDVTVGDIGVVLNDGAYLDYEFYLWADGSAANAGQIGAVNVGDISVASSNGVSAQAYFSFFMSASSGTIESVTFGDISFDVALNGTQQLTAEIYGANLGPVTFGDIDVTMADNASSAGIWITAEAYSGDLASFTLGNVTANLGVGAYLTYVSVDVSASGDIGAVSFGNLVSNQATSASNWYEFEVTSYGGGDIASVTLGNVDIVLGENAYYYGSLDIEAFTGNVGSVTVGDVSLSAATNATGWQYVWVNVDGDVGPVTVGDVSLAAVGTNASVGFSLTVESNGAGDLGTITLGNVAMDATGPSAYAYFYVSASSAANIGTITVGNLDLSMDANAVAAAAESADIYLGIYNTQSDIVVGDINITVADAATGMNDINRVDLDINAAGDLTLGTITVVGDGVVDFNGAGNTLADINNVLANVSWGGTISIAGIDYSGYGAGVTIDVSGYDEVGAIIGSAFADTIIDNDSTNTLTGGAGADIFTFLNTNSGLTQATADKITDWTYGSDTIDITPAINIGNYQEGTYADFATFLSAANAANKAVLAGQVGGSTFLAVDDNTDGTVDFLIELVGITNLNQIAVDSFV